MPLTVLLAAACVRATPPPPEHSTLSAFPPQALTTRDGAEVAIPGEGLLVVEVIRSADW